MSSSSSGPAGRWAVISQCIRTRNSNVAGRFFITTRSFQPSFAPPPLRLDDDTMTTLFAVPLFDIA